MALLDRIFGAARPTTQTPPANQQQPGVFPPGTVLDTPDPALQQQQNNPHVPNPVAEKVVSPLDGYEQLWTIEPPKQGEEDLNSPFRFNVDPAKIQQQANRMDFTKAITPELMTKINAGGSEAMSALIAAMNIVGQTVMAQSSQVNAKILEAGLDASSTRMTKKLPGLVKSQAISEALREDNPLFQNPAVTPLLDAVQEQMQRKFPNATAAEIKAHAQKYLVGFAAEANKAFKVDTTPANARVSPSFDEYDWSQEPV